MLFLYTFTLFVSATLLFLVQPMFAKMVLPILGGTPFIWNTCMVFFQGSLLAGYGYSHLITTRLRARHQAVLHIALLLTSLLTLPIAAHGSGDPPAQQNPVLWLLILLLISVGLPFFVLSTSAPLLQKWFANTGHPSAKDPYFLYAASNLGSVMAMVAYPLLMEPNLRVVNQSWFWTGGYGLLVALMLGCAVILWRSRDVNLQSVPPETSNELRGALPTASDEGSLTVGRRMRWVTLSFVPSSLMLGVTTYFTIDLAPIPLLWVIPLAIYLLSFILVFSKKTFLPHSIMIKALPMAVLVLVVLMLLDSKRPLWFLLSVHLLTFFVIAMVCHGELARSRPSTRHLTEFYLWMSVGGVLGGLFNALVAPALFNTLVEYPLIIVVACLLRPGTKPDGQKRFGRLLDFGLPLGLCALIAGLFWGVNAIGLKPGQLIIFIILSLPIMLCFSFSERPLRFGLGVGAIMLANVIYTGGLFQMGGQGRVLHRERSFFGIHSIEIDPEEKYHLLLHGNTIHGLQSLDPSRRREPLTYYYHNGAIGQVFGALSEGGARAHVAIIGLGSGALACYARHGQQFTFYEIDPAVERIARDPRYFTFLQDCPEKVNVVLGDARLSLRNAPDHHYGLIILDAFSSDTIPVHLLTQEAIDLYLSKLADGGVLAFHISNRYLNLRPVVGDLAQGIGLHCLIQDDVNISEDEQEKGKVPSTWVVMARRQDELGKLVQNSQWKLLSGVAGRRVWTDDFSNILSVLNWD